MGEVGDRAVAGEAAAVRCCGLAGVEHHRGDLALADAHLDAAADLARAERVVAAVHPHVGIGWHAQDDPGVEIRRLGRQRRHRGSLLGQAVDGPAAKGAVGAQVRALIEPAIELIGEVELVGERSPRLEVGLHVALQALDDPLGLGVGGLAEPPADPKAQAWVERVQDQRALAQLFGVSEAAMALRLRQLGLAPERPRWAPLSGDAETGVGRYFRRAALAAGTPPARLGGLVLVGGRS